MEPNWQLTRKRTVLQQRARTLERIRAFFREQDFLEVETPHLIPANAPELHIDAVAAGNGFLQTSPELCMKRLLAAGYQQLFQICRCWRNGERGRYHLPEYTMLEWYRSRADYTELMADCEELLRQLHSTPLLIWQGRTIDLTPPWPRLTVTEAFDRYASLPLKQALELDSFDLLLTEEVEPRLPADRPLFLIDYPAQQASLARLKNGDPSVAERFELYVGGLEIANGFSELTSPDEQRKRFTDEEQLRRQRGKPAYPSPQPFLNELAHLSACAGIALGIDRLIMLLCDCAEIDEVVSFAPEQL